MTWKLMTASAALIAAATGSAAWAGDPQSCKAVQIGNGGWTDNLVQDALVMEVLDGLGYEASQDILALEILMRGVANGEIDVHFDYWSPSSDSLVQPYVEEGRIEVLGPNLTGTKYTLAVPSYAWEAGLKDFADIAKFSDRLDNKIYGQSPGSDSNEIVLDMINKNEFGLGEFKVVESSEQGMLAQVQRMIGSEDFIVFVGWAPHPMNSKYDMRYLSGGDEYFGPDHGSATIYTIARSGLVEECPNLGRFLKNVEFNLDVENTLMSKILDENADPRDAARAWLRDHPDFVESWLDGVTTFNGEPALEPVQASLAE